MDLAATVFLACLAVTAGVAAVAFALIVGRRT